MLTATVIKTCTGQRHTRFSDKGPQTGGEVEVIDVLNQKSGESEFDFRKRCELFNLHLLARELGWVIKPLPPDDPRNAIGDPVAHLERFFPLRR